TPTGAITEFSLSTAGIVPGVLTVGPDGNLWFPEFFPPLARSPLREGKIGRITPTGAITEFPLSTAPLFTALTVRPAGQLCRTRRSAAPVRIGRSAATCAVTEFPLPTNPSFPVFPSVLTVGPDGNLWFPENGGSGLAGRIGRIMPSGVITEFSLSTAGIVP